MYLTQASICILFTMVGGILPVMAFVEVHVHQIRTFLVVSYFLPLHYIGIITLQELYFRIGNPFSFGIIADSR